MCNEVPYKIVVQIRAWPSYDQCQPPGLLVDPAKVDRKVCLLWFPRSKPELEATLPLCVLDEVQ